MCRIYGLKNILLSESVPSVFSLGCNYGERVKASKTFMISEGSMLKPKKTSAAPPPQNTFEFDLAGTAPSISEHGNTVREANQNDFPALAGNGVACFMLEMKPGALRI